MKHLFVLLTATTLFFATTVKAQQQTLATHKTAEVNMFDGIAVFTDCDPVLPYDKVGEVKVGSSGGFGNDSYNSQRDAAIKKMKKDYPNADGILISFKENGACMATAIKFK